MFDAQDPTNPAHYGPSQTALLLLDFHSMLVNHAGGSKAPDALKTAVSLRSWAKKNKVSVIHGLVDIHQPPFSACKDIEMFRTVLQNMQAGGGEEVPELLKTSKEDVTFTRKPGHVSALKSPGLEEYLRKNGIKSLLITGISTSGCVLRTALAATDEEYVTTVISDACADPKQDQHDFLVEHVYPNRGYVATASEFQEAFEKLNRDTS